MTVEPPPVCATSLVTSSVPRLQLVLVTVPRLESTVVVPEASQFHAGDVLKFTSHWLASTLTEGGMATLVQTHMPFEQW